MAVNPNVNALITIAELQTILQTTFSDADYAQSLINMASDIIEKYCGRKFIEDTYTDELYDGNGDKIMYFKNYPISSVTIKDWDSYNNQASYTYTIYMDYLLYETDGYVYKRGGFTKGHKNYAFTYTAGYTQENIPYDLKVACSQIVSYIDRTKTSLGEDEETIGKYSVSYNVDIKLLTAGIPEAILPTLRRYKRYETI